MNVRPKKHLGQHFLTDENIARKIVGQLTPSPAPLVEVGPGTGVLTKYLLDLELDQLLCIDTDQESVDFLKTNYPEHETLFLKADFLKTPLQEMISGNFRIIGNFPYNISSQIFFRVLEYRKQVTEVVGMVQKEVAERIAAPPGNKTYGILSVLLQAYFDIELCFTVSEKVFFPPPKVKSAVIRLIRNQRQQLNCDESLFFEVVKKGFNQRRKTLRNSLRTFQFKDPENAELQHMLTLRPEQLGVEDFERLAGFIDRG